MRKRSLSVWRSHARQVSVVKFISSQIGELIGRITIQNVDVRNIRLFVIAALLFAISCSSADSQREDHLRDRIIDYWRSHSCESKCRNLVIEVRSDIVKVVRFDADHPRKEYVSVQELRAFLKEMPLSAWPKGPRLWLRESDMTIIKKGDDLETVRAAKHQNMITIVQICNELGLTRTKQDGSPLTSEE